MSNCDISSGRLVDCKDSLGGIKAVYIGNYEDMLVQAGWVVAADIVTAIATAGQTFFEFELRPELSSMTVNYMADAASGTTFFEQTCSLTFQKLESTDIADIRELCEGRPNIWILDRNDNVWLLGAENGCHVTGGSIVTGVGYADMNGYTIDFTAREQNPLFMGSAPGGTPSAANWPLDNVTNAVVTVAS
jgi:hypothetical protein